MNESALLYNYLLIGGVLFALGLIGFVLGSLLYLARAPWLVVLLWALSGLGLGFHTLGGQGYLIDALYDPGLSRIQVETEVIFEDGRKGIIAGDLEIRDTKTFHSAQKAG